MVCKMKGHPRGNYWGLGFVWVLAGPLCFLTLPGYCSLLLLVWVLGWSYVVLGRKGEMLEMCGRSVLITGSDTGFGHALAKKLYDKGVTVFAGVLDVKSPGAVELRRRGGGSWGGGGTGGGESAGGGKGTGGELHVLQLDVTDHEQIQQAHQYICSHVGETGLWGVVNNAGILGYVADGEILPLRVYRQCLAVNFLGAVDVCQVFLPLLRRSRGRVVNVCSMAGDVPIPWFAAYAASKAALIRFSGVMRLELARWGIQVAIVQPAGFRTCIFGSSEEWNRCQEEILTNLSNDAREDYGEDYISSIQNCFASMVNRSEEDLGPVLDVLCHALMSPAPRPLYSPGQCGWLIPFLHRHCPTKLYDVIITSLFQFDGCYTPHGLQKNVCSINSEIS
ncbi:estradiol 17-beta-dehydrogenase 2 [Hypomesus transpacificus]|uniref:estradiol 17-beta-dehydrogenase 2 n=1 Tax=Hypomesus transpacificus TaxID=137520 RepID=UPI001F0801D0|nr:estradiol 17-beta-dehydrogenase 2 [Hypomesus transpacificus]